MRHLCTLLLCLGFVPLALADEGDLKEARKRWLKGNYEEARDLFQKHVKDAKLGPAAAVGVSKSWASEGEYDKAKGTIREGVGDVREDVGKKVDDWQSGH